MEKYTKDQLILAMEKYNQRVIDYPDEFSEKGQTLPVKEKAIEQIEYLLSLVD